MNGTANKTPDRKNPCIICCRQVKPKAGLQCQGACKKWAHFSCLNYTPGRVQDIRKGFIQVTCPCPGCDTNKPKEKVITKEKNAKSNHTSTNETCPEYTEISQCTNKDCPKNTELSSCPHCPKPPKCPSSKTSASPNSCTPPKKPTALCKPKSALKGSSQECCRTESEINSESDHDVCFAEAETQFSRKQCPPKPSRSCSCLLKGKPCVKMIADTNCPLVTVSWTCMKKSNDALKCTLEELVGTVRQLTFEVKNLMCKMKELAPRPIAS